MTRLHILVLAAAAAWAAAAPLPARAQPAGAAHLLDVPYLPQSEALCGGAALAMVMRFWGVTGVYAETFQHLLDPQRGGIRTTDLLAAVRERGFEATAGRGDEPLARAALQRGHPPILLIEDRPGRYHYVVLVGWSAGRVVLHDPAAAPFKVVEAADLLRRWGKAEHWMLLAQPAETLRASAAPRPMETPSALHTSASAIVPASSPACAAMVAEGVRRANAGELEDSRGILIAAAEYCVRDAAPWRELAGLHAIRGQWSDAARLARRAIAIDARDEHAARILATALFLEGNDLGALAAWNRLAEPLVDIVEIEGLAHTRYAVAAAALALEPQRLLTPASLQRARRRLRAVPAVTGSRVSFTPAEDGRVRVAAAAIERPRVPSDRVSLAAIGVRTAIDRELSMTLGSVLQQGEAWNVAWRWWPNRPRLAFTLAAPASWGGTWTLDVSGERQTYGARTPLEEGRRAASLAYSDWITGDTAFDVRASIERWPAGTGTVIGGGIERRVGSDRGSLGGTVALLAGAVTSWSLAADGSWRTRSRREGTVVSAALGFGAVGEAAPFAFWPGAGTGQGRGQALLRAHPLLEDGVFADAAMGRRLVHATIEIVRWPRQRIKAMRFAPAVFADAARARMGAAFSDERAHLDVGTGVRIDTPLPGVLRVDLARGLRDGRMALSFGWTR